MGPRSRIRFRMRVHRELACCLSPRTPPADTSCWRWHSLASVPVAGTGSGTGTGTGGPVPVGYRPVPGPGPVPVPGPVRYRVVADRLSGDSSHCSAQTLRGRRHYTAVTPFVLPFARATLPLRTLTVLSCAPLFSHRHNRPSHFIVVVRPRLARRATPHLAPASSEVLVHLSYQITLLLQMQRSSVSSFPSLGLMPRPLR